MQNISASMRSRLNKVGYLKFYLTVYKNYVVAFKLFLKLKLLKLI